MLPPSRLTVIPYMEDLWVLHKHQFVFHTFLQQVASLAQLLPPRSPTVSNPAPDSSLCCCSPIASAGVRFSCCSPLASTSAATPQLRPLQLLLAACVHFSCCSRLCPLNSTAPRASGCFNCSSPIASASTAPRSCVRFQRLLARLRLLQLLLF